MNKRQCKKERTKNSLFGIYSKSEGGCKELYREKYDAVNFFKKALSREGCSINKWEYTGHPATGMYVFFNKRKNKEITIFFDEKKNSFAIFSTDIFWKYSTAHNMYEHATIEEALKAPWQRYNLMKRC